MSGHFGIDASAPFGQVINTVIARLTKPVWIGRYLYQIPAVSTGLTTAEVTDIHAAGLALMVIANDTSAAGVAGSYQDGYAAGQKALAAARALGAPSGIAICVDWEANMFPSGAWAHGFMDAITAGNCRAVFYLNPNIAAHVTAYQEARVAGGKAAYYSSEPEWNAWFDTLRTDFTPALIPGYEGEALYHQYSENNLGGIADLDVCTDAGLALLWGPKPPVTRVAVIQAGLKPLPDHVHASIGTTHLGDTLTFTGQVTPHWAQAKMTSGDCKGKEGWLLRADLHTA